MIPYIKITNIIDNKKSSVNQCNSITFTERVYNENTFYGNISKDIVKPKHLTLSLASVAIV